MSPEIHGAHRRAMSGLFLNPSLFFKINESEWMVFKDQGKTSDTTRENIQLMHPWETQTEKPHFQFDLFRFGSRTKARWSM